MNRRTFVRASAATIAARMVAPRLLRANALPVERPRPSASQLRWQRDEMAMFLHFGVNTFTDREWGDGREDPAIFAPTQLDARQWARTARAADFRSVILTAKHHDGFCLWPTRTTSHSVASGPFRGGTGDVVREMVDACRAEGLRPGLYLSPWDRNNPLYGDSPRYNDLYCDQLTELLTNYGPLAEVWFDGANGEGPNGRKQTYDWPRVWSLVRRLQPNAVMFSDAGPDARWCGNENGSGGEPNWSTVNPDTVRYPGQDGPGVTAALQHGDAAGTVWRPAEADTSIRKGWFYHSDDDATVRTEDDLYDLYFKSVGRNAKLLLNVPPTRGGLLHATDVSRLTGFRDRLTGLRESRIQGTARWTSTGPRTAEVILDLGRATPISAFRLGENIEEGQSVAKWSLYGATDAEWGLLSRGTTIGYARMGRLEPTVVRRIRLVIEDVIETAGEVTVAVYAQ